MGAWPATSSRRSTAGRTRAPSDWPTSSSTGSPAADDVVGDAFTRILAVLRRPRRIRTPTSERQSSTRSRRAPAGSPQSAVAGGALDGPVEVPDPTPRRGREPACRASAPHWFCGTGRRCADHTVARGGVEPALRPLIVRTLAGLGRRDGWRTGRSDHDTSTTYRHRRRTRSSRRLRGSIARSGDAARARVARSRVPLPTRQSRRRPILLIGSVAATLVATVRGDVAATGRSTE